MQHLGMCTSAICFSHVHGDCKWADANGVDAAHQALLSQAQYAQKAMFPLSLLCYNVECSTMHSC